MIRGIFTVSLFILVFCNNSLASSQHQPNWEYQGRLEIAESNYIIVSDSRYVVDSTLKYFALSGKYVSKYDFTEGTKVALSINETTGKVTALWLVDADIP